MAPSPPKQRCDRGEPTVWMGRAGEAASRPGIRAAGAVFRGGEAGDLTGLSLEAVRRQSGSYLARVRPAYTGQAANGLYKFAHDMQPGDVVVTPDPRAGPC